MIKKSALLLLVLALALALAAPGQAVVVNFDDLGLGQVPAVYAGLNWDGNFHVYDEVSYQIGYGNTLTFFPSYANAAYNGYGVPTAVVSNGPINVIGAYFTSWADNNGWGSWSSTGLDVSGFLGANLVGTVSVPLQPVGFVYAPLNFNNVDRLEIRTVEGVSGYWWLMDNLE